jgi:hypothetical protein
MEELRCKHPISWAWSFKGDVSQLNDNSYNPKMVGNATFIHLKMPSEPTKIAKEGDE